MSDLKTVLHPVSSFVAEMELSDPRKAEAQLAERFPADSDEIQAIVQAARTALEEGEICTRGEDPMRYSRVVKSEENVGGCSIDAVYMDSTKGPGHTHPNGEVCLCLNESGEPSFEENSGPWVVMPPGSHHEPEVKTGAMLILYWLPAGAVTWG